MGGIASSTRPVAGAGGRGAAWHRQGGRCRGRSTHRSRLVGRGHARRVGGGGVGRGGHDARRAARPLGVAREPPAAGGQKATVKAVGAIALLALAGLVLFPGVAHAWTPGTHIFLGESVLANLYQLPTTVADLPRALPYDFLYGTIPADTPIA